MTTKKLKQQEELKNTIDIVGCNELRAQLVEQGKAKKEEFKRIKAECEQKVLEVVAEKQKWYDKKLECATLGKQEKDWYNTFKDYDAKEVLNFPTKKDDTDAELALSYVLKNLQADNIYLYKNT